MPLRSRGASATTQRAGRTIAQQARRCALLLGGLLGAACSLTSLDSYFECPPDNPTCKGSPIETGGGGSSGAGAAEGGSGGIPIGGAGGSSNVAGTTSESGAAGAAGAAGSVSLGGPGDPCTLDEECAQGTCYTHACGDALEIAYAPIDDPKWIKFQIKITNRTAETYDLSSLKVRYYFTPEAVTPDYQVLSAGEPTNQEDVTGRFDTLIVGNPRTTYFEIGFDAAAGALAGGKTTGLIRLSITAKDFGPGTFYQDDDYSHLQPTHLTLYRNGALVSGIPPQ